MSFRNDYEEGYKLEYFVSQIFGTEPHEGYLKEYDLKIEVKKDLMHKKTGNVAIEIYYKGQPSGRINGANKLVYEVLDCIWVCNVEKVKEYIRENQEDIRFVDGGDDNLARFALLPLSEFINLFTWVMQA